MKKVKDLKDIPSSWEVDEDEKIELELYLKKEDPYVKLYAGWRDFMGSLSDRERKVIRKWTCGEQSCSNEEINNVVKATKGTLDKK